MTAAKENAIGDLVSLLFQAHPWHGVSPGEGAPAVVSAYIEIVPTDAVKYETDKRSGHLKVDRPQRFSSFPPTLYGFIPQTFCGDRVGELCRETLGGGGAAIRGDGDPMDVCVLTERPAAHAGFLVTARAIGGLRMVDGNEADDKIIAVLENDTIWGNVQDIKDLPDVFTERLRHYFATYKMTPSKPTKISIEGVYGCDHACQVVEAAVADYNEEFGQ